VYDGKQEKISKTNFLFGFCTKKAACHLQQTASADISLKIQFFAKKDNCPS